MIGAVEDDEFDIQSGLKAGWAITFCVLYIIVMIISILCYFVTVRAVALEIRAHNTTYLLILLLFFAAIIEFGVIVGGIDCIPFEMRLLTNYICRVDGEVWVFLLLRHKLQTVDIRHLWK